MLKVTRRSFDFTDSPKYYFANNQLVTQLFNALSATFPRGEQFFVDSVRAFRDKLPRTHELQKDISGFIGQEAMHSLAHKQFNAYCDFHGIPLLSVEKGVGKLLELVKKTLPPRLQLAATVCLEHYTAIMAGQLLMEEMFNEEIRGELRELWMWHAKEEVAHAHVAWDLYHMPEVGGNYAERVAMMLLTSVVFIVAVAHLTHILVAKDGFKRVDFVPGLKYLVGKRGFFTTLIPDYLLFFKPGFHPNQHTRGVLRAIENTENDRCEPAVAEPEVVPESASKPRKPRKPKAAVK